MVLESIKTFVNQVSTLWKQILAGLYVAHIDTAISVHSSTTQCNSFKLLKVQKKKKKERKKEKETSFWKRNWTFL